MASRTARRHTTKDLNERHIMRTSSTYPTDAQISYCKDLISKKDFRHSEKMPSDITDMQVQEVQRDMLLLLDQKIEDGSMTRAGISEWIDRLKAMPTFVPKPINPTDRARINEAANLGDTQQPALCDVPAGRYAIATPRATNEHSFFQVDRPTDGRWAGYLFVSQLVGPEKMPIRNRQSRDIVLQEIAAAGIEESMLLYGQLIGKCGHCGRRLTNDESRAVGIGPVCRGKLEF